MNIFAAFALVALGIVLSETYAFIRRRAEEAAYERGYRQTLHEEEIRSFVTSQYAVTVPRRLTDHEASNMQPVKPSCAAGMVWRPVEAVKPDLVGQDFMDHMQVNGQATTWLGRE